MLFDLDFFSVITTIISFRKKSITHSNLTTLAVAVFLPYSLQTKYSFKEKNTSCSSACGSGATCPHGSSYLVMSQPSVRQSEADGAASLFEFHVALDERLQRMEEGREREREK